MFLLYNCTYIIINLIGQFTSPCRSLYEGGNMINIIIDILKIVTQIILTGIISFLITRYTTRRNLPLDKLEKAYNKVYYPIYCLIVDENDKGVAFVIRKSTKYLEKHKKYVDRSTKIAFENLKKNYDELEYDKSLYDNFKLNIYNYNSKLRRQLGYLEPNIYTMYKYNTPTKRYVMRIILYFAISFILCYIISPFPFEQKNFVILSIFLILLIVSISESIVILLRVLVGKLKKCYIKHKRRRNVSI